MPQGNPEAYDFARPTADQLEQAYKLPIAERIQQYGPVYKSLDEFLSHLTGQTGAPSTSQQNSQLREAALQMISSGDVTVGDTNPPAGNAAPLIDILVADLPPVPGTQSATTEAGQTAPIPSTKPSFGADDVEQASIPRKGENDDDDDFLPLLPPAFRGTGERVRNYSQSRGTAISPILETIQATETTPEGSSSAREVRQSNNAQIEPPRRQLTGPTENPSTNEPPRSLIYNLDDDDAPFTPPPGDFSDSGSSGINGATRSAGTNADQNAIVNQFIQQLGELSPNTAQQVDNLNLGIPDNAVPNVALVAQRTGQPYQQVLGEVVSKINTLMQRGSSTEAQAIAEAFDIPSEFLQGTTSSLSTSASTGRRQAPNSQNSIIPLLSRRLGSLRSIR